MTRCVNWMQEVVIGLARFSRKRLELPIVILLALPAVWALAQPGVPLTDDGRFHIGRIDDLRGALAVGGLFPRWVEPLVEGLGFPLFNFYPPLSHYLALGLTLLGLGDADAFKLASALFPILGAAGMYLWMIVVLSRVDVADRTRKIAAMGAGVAYAYAPYQLVEIYRRGALAEAFALSLLPLLFYTVERLRQAPCVSNSLLVAPVLSAIIIAHNAMAALGLGMILSFATFSSWPDRLSPPRVVTRPPSIRRTLLCYLLAIGLGLGMSSLYWVPAAAERSYVTFDRLSTGFFGAANHLDDGWPPVQLTLVFDFNNHPFRAGLVQVLAVLPGLVPVVSVTRSFLRKPKTRSQGFASRPVMAGDGQSRPMPMHSEPVAAACESVDVNGIERSTYELARVSGFFTLSALVIIFLLSPLALWIWRDVPILKEMQFPWRTLGLFAFSSATLAGVGLAWLGSRWPHALSFVAMLVLAGYIAASLASLPTDFSPPPEEDFGTSSMVAVSAGWDMRSTEPSRSPSPADADALASLRSMERRPGQINLEVDVRRTTTLVLHTLYFPGWRASVDGLQTPVFPVSERGLLGFSVPEGNHKAQLRFESTPLRLAAEVGSAASAFVLLALVLASVVRRRPAVAAALGAAALACLIAIPRLAAMEPPLPEFRSLSLPAVAGVRLLGVSIEPRQEGRLGLILYWQALEALGDLDSFVALVDDEGNTAGRPDRRPLESAYPTARWQVGEIVPDRVEIELPPGLDTTALRVIAGFRLPGPMESTVPTASFSFRLSGDQPAAIDVPNMIRLGSLLGLEGYSPMPSVVSPGGDLPIDLRWRSLGSIPGNVIVYVHLIGANGTMRSQVDSPPGPKSYPAVLWAPGERVREERRLAIPEDTPPGRYSLRWGGYSYPDLQGLPLRIGEAAGTAGAVLGDVFVVAPQTRPTAVSPMVPARVVFGDQIELVGYDLPGGDLRAGRELTVVTYWRALRSIDADYTLLAHIVDSAGNLRGQTDGQPANGSYPTSLWKPGEYVVDKRTIKLDSASPAGTYRIAAGFYSWPTMERLPAVREGSRLGDAVELGLLRVLSASQ